MSPGDPHGGRPSPQGLGPGGITPACRARGHDHDDEYPRRPPYIGPPAVFAPAAAERAEEDYQQQHNSWQDPWWEAPFRRLGGPRGVSGPALRPAPPSTSCGNGAGPSTHTVCGHRRAAAVDHVSAQSKRAIFGQSGSAWPCSWCAGRRRYAIGRHALPAPPEDPGPRPRRSPPRAKFGANSTGGSPAAPLAVSTGGSTGVRRVVRPAAPPVAPTGGSTGRSTGVSTGVLAGRLFGEHASPSRARGLVREVMASELIRSAS